jgi:hypothetical protein
MLRRRISDGLAWCVSIVLLTACSPGAGKPASTPAGFISEQEAVEQAQLGCEQAHSPPEEPPQNIEAELLTCREVDAQTSFSGCRDEPPDLKAWFVSMDGLWFHEGPPGEEGANSPIPFRHCSVLMDAETGRLMELQSNE